MIRVSYKNIWNFAVHYWKRRLKSGLAAVLLMLAAVISDMILPIYVGKTVDVLAQGTVNDAGSLNQAIRYFMIFVGLGVAFSFLRSASIFFWNWFAVYNLYDIVNEGMRKVQRFSADWHANAFAGGTVRKVTRGMWSFDVFEDTLFMGLFPAVCMMVGMAIMLIIQVPDVGYFAAAMIVFYAGFSIWVSVKILAPRFRESATADTKLIGRAHV